ALSAANCCDVIVRETSSSHSTFNTGLARRTRWPWCCVRSSGGGFWFTPVHDRVFLNWAQSWRELPQRGAAAGFFGAELCLCRPGPRPVVAAAPQLPARLGHRTGVLRTEHGCGVPGRNPGMEQLDLPGVVLVRCLSGAGLPGRGDALPSQEDPVRLFRRGVDRARRPLLPRCDREV